MVKGNAISSVKSPERICHLVHRNFLLTFFYLIRIIKVDIVFPAWSNDTIFIVLKISLQILTDIAFLLKGVKQSLCYVYQ